MTDNVQLDEETLASIRKQIKEEVLAEFANADARQEEAKKERRKKERRASDDYVTLMKNSDEPWIDIQSWGIDPEHGIKVEMDWNDAFVQLQRNNGLTGTDDDQVVQKWLALLLRDMNDRSADTTEDEESEFK